MAFQSRFRETERHAFGERGGHGADASSGEPSEVRTNTNLCQNCTHTPTTQTVMSSPNYELHAFPLCFHS